MTFRQVQRWSITPLVVLLALLPAYLLAWNAWHGRLSANPIKDVTETTGIWTLRFLMITLAIRPLRKVPGLAWVSRYRRMMGLFAFTYGFLHLGTYVGLDQFFDFGMIVDDVMKRPFITAGVTAFTLLIPLAVTSTDGMIRRVGGKRWKMLHRLIYASACCGVIHYLWLIKADKQRPLAYGALLAVLLGYRIWEYWQGRRRAPAR
jgi:sulfoxide reductase heme-binding subunit YedZ